MSLVVVKDDCGKHFVNFELLSDLLDEVDIPELVKKYKNMLRFPDKVNLQVMKVGTQELGTSHRLIILCDIERSQLMLLMTFVERTTVKRGKKPEDACISWAEDGNALIIRNQSELVRHTLPRVFHCHGTFASFTRKLYRWGFRQNTVKVSKGVPPITGHIKVFFHECFQRDNKKLMVNMRSATTERANRADSHLPQTIQVPANAGTGFSTLAFPHQQDTLLSRFPARSPTDPTLGHQLQQAAAAAETCFSRFSGPFPSIIDRQGLAASPYLQAVAMQHSLKVAARPFVSPVTQYAIKSTLLQNVVAIEMKQQRQTEIIAQAL
jgi:hypothetical protein